MEDLLQKGLLSSEELLILHGHLIRSLFSFEIFFFFLFFIAATRSLGYRVMILKQLLLHVLFSSLLWYDDISQIAQVLSVVAVVFMMRRRRG
jgi:hypothetical protein